MFEPMARTRSSASDKRTAILDAALHLFVERGFHGTAVPLVASRAGVGAGTIYRYFDSKEALVNELYRECKQKLSAALLAGFDPMGPAREQFRRIWMRMADFVEQSPTAYTFLELHHHKSYLDDESRQIEQQLNQLTITFIRSAQGRGEFRDLDPAILWALTEGAFIGLVRSAKEGRLQLGAAEIEAAEEACWEMICAR